MIEESGQVCVYCDGKIVREYHKELVGLKEAKITDRYYCEKCNLKYREATVEELCN